MEKIIESFDKLAIKMGNVDDAMIVLPHKPELLVQLSKLSALDKEVEDLEESIKISLKDHDETLRAEYSETTQVISRVQLKMMHLLQHFEDKEKHQKTEKRALQEINLPHTPKLFDRDGAAQAFAETNTPHMMIADYAKSPFAKKRTKVQLTFADFEAEITKEDFAKVPGYMRGRTAPSDLQDFLDNVVIRTFNDKYQLLYKQRSILKPSEFGLQTMFKDQASYFEGMKFITVGDMARILAKNVDKKDDRFLQMLRHLQILREARKNSTICYIWLKKS